VQEYFEKEQRYRCLPYGGERVSLRGDVQNHDHQERDYQGANDGDRNHVEHEMDSLDPLTHLSLPFLLYRYYHLVGNLRGSIRNKKPTTPINIGTKKPMKTPQMGSTGLFPQ